MKKYVIVSGILILFCLSFLIYQFIVFHDGKLHVTICDVGQGDAVLLRTPQDRTVLFDGGPDDSVLKCLADSLPVWQRHIDLILLSHPHADHLNGLVSVFNRYSVGQFATEDLANTSDGYKALQEAVKREGIMWQTLLDGDLVKLEPGIQMSVVGPTRAFLDQTAVKGKYITSSEFASLEILLTYGQFSLLLTGDSQYQEMGQMVSSHHLPPLTVLQEPHHGSRTGITPEIIASLHPQLVTISVGAHNTYGHPAPSTLMTLQNAHVHISRTDQEGTLRLITNGKSYNIE